MEINYGNFNATDFLEDRRFIEWVKYRPPELEKFWSEWRATKPLNLAAFNEAERQLTLILSAERFEPQTGEKREVLQKILKSIGEAGEKILIRKRHIRRWMIAASAAAVLIVVGALWFVIGDRNSRTMVTTAYGEIKKIVLPDQSQIILNAHSHIAFKVNWKGDEPREVWLEGEAHFDVKHLNIQNAAVRENDRFIIHTNLMVVEVLGTVFNVKERRGRVEVSLESGSVKVMIKNGKNKGWILKPGELAVFNDGANELEMQVQNPEIHKAWTDRKMLADNTTLQEIIQTIEDQYGYKVILEDSELANRRIDGTIPFKSESNILFVLSNILQIDIVKNDNVLIFKSRK